MESKTPVRIRCEFAEAESELYRPDAPTLVLTSLLGEMDRLGDPWADAESRLRARYAALSADGRRVVYVCTLLRHIGEDLSRSARDMRRVRLRRLNLLAVELSRELGLIVVDIDRDLAALGAASLETDYRLGGPYAASAAGKSIAMTLLMIGLDDWVDYPLQEHARSIVGNFQPPHKAETVSRPRMVGGHTVVVRSGKRRQMVESTIDTVDENFVALHLQRLLKGQMAWKEAVAILMGAVARSGWRRSFARLIAGVRKLARAKT